MELNLYSVCSFVFWLLIVDLKHWIFGLYFEKSCYFLFDSRILSISRLYLRLYIYVYKQRNVRIIKFLFYICWVVLLGYSSMLHLPGIFSRISVIYTYILSLCHLHIFLSCRRTFSCLLNLRHLFHGAKSGLLEVASLHAFSFLNPHKAKIIMGAVMCEKGHERVKYETPFLVIWGAEHSSWHCDYCLRSFLQLFFCFFFKI